MKVFLFAGLVVSLILFGCLGGGAPSASPEPSMSPTVTATPLAGVSDDVSAAINSIDEVLGDSAAVGNDTSGIDDELNVTNQDLDA